jgi:hypothetical protein
MLSHPKPISTLLVKGGRKKGRKPVNGPNRSLLIRQKAQHEQKQTCLPDRKQLMFLKKTAYE